MYNQSSHIVCYLYVGRGRSVILTLAVRKKRRTYMHIRNNSGVFSELFFFLYMWRYVHCPVFKIYCKSSIISLHSINICKIRELFMPVSKFLKRIEYPHLLGKIKCREFLLNQSFGGKKWDILINWINYLAYRVLISEHILGGL